jgi:RNA polymerase sigma-70 factor, ECF subfamily
VDRWSEESLASRIVAGNREACVQFVRLHHAPIYRLLVRLCGDRHLAEDLTQETFAAGWAGIGAFNGTCSLGTWLHRIAYRKFVDAYRRGSRGNIRSNADEAIRQIHSTARNPLDEVLAGEQSRELQRAIDRLKPAERDVIVLHYLQGLSFREMAHVLDEPAGTVKWRTSQALEDLRTLLGGQQTDETGQTSESSTR